MDQGECERVNEVYEPITLCFIRIFLKGEWVGENGKGELDRERYESITTDIKICQFLSLCFIK